MAYALDQTKLSVEAYRDLLKSQNLLPGRRALLCDIDNIFGRIRDAGIENAEQLSKALSTAQRRTLFAQIAQVDEDYLVLLRRELGSLEQKPVPLTSFPGIDSASLPNNVHTSKEYYETCSEKAGELFCLCDLVRINGVGAVAARAFYEAGFRSANDVASADAADMLKAVTRVNEEKGYYKAKLGEKDMQFCIDFAKLLILYSD